MKKIARTTMIAAVGIAGLSLISLLICLLFQRTFVDMQYGGVGDQVYFMLPVGAFLSCGGSFAVTLVMLFGACNERFPLKVDAICAGVAVIGIPLIRYSFDMVQNWFVLEAMGVDAALYLSRLNGVCSSSQILLPVAVSLTVLACGMSIAVKYLNSKK